MECLEKNNIRRLVVFALFVTSTLAFNIVSAASLYLSPESGNYTAGQNFSIGIYVSETETDINAVSGLISFPSQLGVISISKTGSIVNFWVQEPSTESNSINFEGVILNPGFKGTAGKILTINFKAKSVGNLNLAFINSSVLANDGLGTNILSNLGKGTYAITAQINEPTADISTTPNAGIPYATLITSSSHPNPSSWYTETTAKFSWKAPKGTISTRLSLNKKPSASPSVLYTKSIEEKVVEDLGDGTWYFHVQFKNEYGWGSISHYKIQIDTSIPNIFELEFIEGDLQPTILFKSNDSTSEIDYYEIKIDNQEPIKTQEVSTRENPFIIPPQEPGRHTITVQAFDEAGNHRMTSGEFETTAIEQPVIIYHPTELNNGDTLIIKGKTYPNATITVFLSSENESTKKQEIQSDKDGKFIFIWKDKLKKGIYESRIQVTRVDGAKSELSDPIIISVRKSSLITIGLMSMSFISLIGALAIIIAMLFMAWRAWYSFKTVLERRKRVLREVSEIDSEIEKVFTTLKDEIKKQVIILSRSKSARGLKTKEKMILKSLLRNCDHSKKSLKKEVNDVKKEIKEVTKELNKIKSTKKRK